MCSSDNDGVGNAIKRFPRNAPDDKINSLLSIITVAIPFQTLRYIFRLCRNQSKAQHIAR